MCIVPFPSLTPVKVPMTVPAPVLQMALTPNTVDLTVTSAPDEDTVPFRPEVQATERLPLLITSVVWEQPVNVSFETAPPTLAPVNGLEVEPSTSDPVHVSLVVPFLSLRIAEVPEARLALMDSEVVTATPFVASVVAEALPAATAIRASAAIAARPNVFRYFICFSL